MSRAYIALGSNLGDRRAHLEAALRLIKTPAIKVSAVSGFYQTPPVDCPPDSPPFLNATAALETGLSPRALLDRLLDVERELGRVRQGEPRYAPRTVDLDLLLYDELVLEEPGLVIPHPRMHRRRFVLAPLAEIAPEFHHPVLQQTIAKLLAAVESAETPPMRRGAAGGVD